ncbi:MAG: hypothetical protein KIT89_05560 [Microcella sp.]|uniref:hypothetical protein n=1 Tax=Microcella sp. TaxID=1913979 RepID=UPI0024C8B794|nr:hypothetical protein [Microcella sp.]UYN84637.1 MAG: hypothetical protein KIT89_05560 [Microcella sp.]
MSAPSAVAIRRHRVAASALVAVVATLVAASAHAIAGGGVPSIVAVAGALLVSVPLGMIVVGRRLTRARVAAGVALDQVVFHALFSFFGASGASTVASAGGHHGGHGMLEITLGASTTASTAAMVVSHLGAAVIAYAMLRHAVAALASIVAALGVALLRALEPELTLPPAPPPLRLRAHGHHAAHSFDALVRLPDRRGPPAPAVV